MVNSLVDDSVRSPKYPVKLCTWADAHTNATTGPLVETEL